MDLFDLFVKIGVDDQASDHVSNLASKLGNGLKAASAIGTAAVTAAATAIGVLTKQSIESYAEYDQLVGGVETLFKDSADTVQEYAANAYKTAGLSANDYMSTVTSFSASLLQSLSGDTHTAAEYANQALVDMSDNANKMGTDMEMIQNAYQGFAKQNYTMLDNLKLGYGGTKTEMERLIADAAALSDTVDAQSLSFANIVEAIHVVQIEMGITGTTAKEAAETISGSTASAKAAWSNLLTGIADDNADMDVLVNNFVDSIVIAGENILPRIETILLGIGTMVEKIAPMISQRLPSIVKAVLPGLLNAAIDMVNSIADELPGLIESLVPVIAEAAPKIMMAGMALTKALTAGLLKAVTNADTIQSIISALMEMAQIFISRKVEMVQAAIGVIRNIAAGIVEHAADIVPFIQSFIGMVGQFISENITPMVQAAINIVKTIGSGIIEHINAAIPMVIEFINGIVGLIVDNAVEFANAALDIVKTIGSSIVEFLPKILPAIVDFVMGIAVYITNPDVLSPILDGALYIILAIADGLTENLPAILTAVTNLILYLAERLTDPDTLVSLVDAALEIIIALATGLIENTPFLFEKIPTIIKNLVETIIRSAPKLFDAAVEIIKSLVKGIKDNAGLILNTASDLIFTIAEGLVKYFYMLVSKGKEIVDSVKSGFSQKLSGAKTWGKDLIDNFIGGIKEKWNNLKNTVKDVAQSIKDLLGFSEPKEGPLSNFHTYAPDMMHLFAQGIRENEHVITDQIEKSFDFGERTISAAYDISASGGAAKSGVTVIQNIYSQAQTAADLMQEAQWEAERAVLFGV